MNDLIRLLHATESRHSFWAFRQFINPKLKTGWWTREVAHELQEFWGDYLIGKRPSLVIQAPPQHGKSVAILDFIAWIAGNDPDKKIIFASFSNRLGVRANLAIKRIINGDRYKQVFPDTVIGSKNTQDYFEYDESVGFFRNTTVNGSITGESLDIGIIDDPIKGRRESNSEVVRNAAWDWLSDDFGTRFADDAAQLIILTRWHVDDPVGRLIDIDKDVKVLTYPAIAEENEEHRAEGQALFPEHKSLDFLHSRKSKMLSSSWESLYQQNPSVSTGNMFNPDNIYVIDILPSTCQHFVRAWDFAATTSGDWTVGVKMAVFGEIWIVCDVVRMRGLPHDVRKTLLDTAKRDGRRCKIIIPQDPGQAGKAQVLSMTSMLRGFNVNSNVVSGSKEVRADSFASQVNVENIAMLRAGWNEIFTDELRHFPNGKYDDQVDAATDAFEELCNIGEIDDFEYEETGRGY